MEITDILKTTIKEFRDNGKIILIATFGSAIHKDVNSMDDFDLITICSKEIHEQFLKLFLKNLRKKFEVKVFKTIINKPKKENKNQILIHDLHYRSFNELNNEWKTVINDLKKEGICIYGDRNFKRKLKFYEIKEKDLTTPFLKWARKIKTIEQYDTFKRHLLKIIPSMMKKYPATKFDKLKKVKILLNRKDKWNKNLEKIKQTLHS